ncbi:MAG: FadR family transcriptional regulator [Desulfobulbus sp.]|jgi:GntR family transcriptional repressor for pyruvate dehydrogenase complex|uniref:FadR/GntR family transcriptional regulator n=1 Tax=Desulfobulbus sp. TaxID=895 RepID=UPI00284DDBD6|nr:FadR/GntR family transcriptional regulator [Desulfobulbus sp.]MDR2548725.1 FadR family transcriptional regulator [Desulfobulbus sp.]
MKFKPIKPKKVSSQIADQIRDSILAGDFTPGEKLPPERELAEMFGVSRPSVREALNLLASSGLVMSYQGGGTVVLSLVEAGQGNTLSDLIRSQQERALEVIEVRKCMESWTAYYAAQRARSEDLCRMEEILAGMEMNLGADLPSEDLDANLHIVIARATHNVVWLHLMQSIFDAMKEFQRGVWRAVYLTAEDRNLLFRHHADIVAAIRSRDAEAARDTMLHHLSFAEKRSIAYVARGAV